MVYKGDDYYINNIKNGKINEFSYIVDQYKDIVYSIVFNIVKNDDDAEELSQEVFIKVYKSLNSFKGKSKLSTWIYKIAYNTSINFIKRNKIKTQNIDDIQINDSDDTIFEKINLENRISDLENAMKKLNHEDYTLILLHYYEEQSVKEISKITNMSISNVKIKLFRARKKLEILILNK